MTRLSIAALMTFVLLVGPVAAQTCSFICINGQPTQPAGPPQGRLTLVSDSPVMTASQSAATTIYYTPYNGNLVPIYNGTAFLATPFSELSNITTNSSTRSANAGGGNNVVGVGYDSTTAASGRLQWGTGSTTSFGQPNASYSVQPLGFHFGQML